MHALTAAHPSLPLGTRVLVTNVKNGRSVEVCINDRGPIVRGRIIDLSYAAAQRLGAVDEGTFRVELRTLSDWVDSPAAAPASEEDRRGSVLDERQSANQGTGVERAGFASSGSTSSGPIRSIPARAPLTAATSISTRASGRASPATRQPRLAGWLFANQSGA